RLRRIGFGVGTMVLAGAYLLIRYSIGGAREFEVLQISIPTGLAILAALVGLTIPWASLVDRSQRWVKPTKYPDRLVWVRGAGRVFLQTLPRIEDHHHKPGSDNPHLDADELIRRGEHADED